MGFCRSILRRSAVCLSASLLALASLLYALPRQAEAATHDITCGDTAALISTMASAASGDIINLNSDNVTSCTYTLTAMHNTDPDGYGNGLPQVTDQLTINGNGSTITRSWIDLRFLYVSSSGTLSLNHLTLTNGNDRNGGAICNAGTLNVSDSTIWGNNGGGISNTGMATVSNSTLFSNQTSAIRCYGGTMAVSNSTFAGNSSAWGGAIDARKCKLIVNGSAFSSNYCSEYGGAISSWGSPTDINNCTFAGNWAIKRGGAVRNGGWCAINVRNSTFSGNYIQEDWGIGGATIDNTQDKTSGKVIISNSILVGDTKVCIGGWGGLTDGGHNLAYGASIDKCKFQIASQNPLSAAGLADNGGPTQTIAFSTGWANPAIGGGDPAVCAADPINNLDQRGEVRPQPAGTICDIGSFEDNGAASIIILTGDKQRAKVYTGFTEPLMVKVTDNNSNPLPFARVYFSAPTTEAGAVFYNNPADTDATGQASVTAQANDIAGNYAVIASSGSASVSFSLSNTPGPPSRISIAQGDNQSAAVTTNFTTPLVAKVTDNNSNPVPGLSITFTSPYSGASAVITGSPATTDEMGQAMITAQANDIVGKYIINAALPTGISVNFNLTNVVALSTSTTTTVPVEKTYLQVVPNTVVKLLYGANRSQNLSGSQHTQALDPGAAMGLLKIAGFATPLQLFVFIGDEDTVFDRGERPVWNTDAIQTLMKLKLTKRSMLALAFIDPFTAQAGTYEVAIGDCGGSVELLEP